MLEAHLGFVADFCKSVDCPWNLVSKVKVLT